MTLGIVIANRRGVWVAADRRLGPPVAKSHLATKLVRLETTDARGVITYAGIGARAHSKPFEVSEWIGRTVRNRRLTLNKTLGLIAHEATNAALHRFGGPHTFLFGGFENSLPVIEIISTRIILTARSGTSPFPAGGVSLKEPGFNRHRLHDLGRQTVCFPIGSGARDVDNSAFHRISRFLRNVTDIRGLDLAVSMELSKAIRRANLRDSKRVSAECVYTSVLAESENGPGGQQAAFDGEGQRSSRLWIPTIVAGIDVNNVIEAIIPIVSKALAMRTSPDVDEMNSAIAKLDFKPDSRF